MLRGRPFWAVALLACSWAAFAPAEARSQGIIFPGSGAAHRSMAGASTAAAWDALGALYWNPAVIGRLPHSEVVIGGEFLIPDTHLGSTLPAGAAGPGNPPVTLSGFTRSDNGVGLASGVGLVYVPEESDLTYGMGLFTIAGGAVNFPGTPDNPILAPVGPNSMFVLGPQAASATVITMMPTVAYRLNDRVTVGGGPMIDAAVVSFDPAFFGPPDDSNGDGLFTFPTGSHSRPFWGAGFRMGFTYQVADHLTAGFSFTSPQWFETWKFYARNEVGAPIIFRTQFSLPIIYSAGLAYDGIDRLLLTTDLRYFDYASTELLGDIAGWQNVWAAAFGGRYQLNEQLSVQAGYLYNDNPISSNLVLFNTQLPALTQHTLSLGAYMQLNESIGMSLAYVHGFENSLTGTIPQLPGTTVTLDTEYDSLAFGLHVKFGAPKRRPCECVPCAAEAPAPAEPPPPSPLPILP